MSDLNEFVAWVKEQPNNRMCQITIEQNVLGKGVDVKPWVYDMFLMSGQIVDSVSEINLQAAKEQKERDEYEKLKKKYGGAA